MCIFDKEFKKKNKKKSNYQSQRTEYKPRTATIFTGKNDKTIPIPSYWKLR